MCVSKYLACFLLFFLSVFFREIFILQVAGLVLTYNFSDCDFEEIRKEYDKVIYPVLDVYIKQIESTKFSKPDYCKDWPFLNHNLCLPFYSNGFCCVSHLFFNSCQLFLPLFSPPPPFFSPFFVIFASLEQLDCLTKIVSVTFNPTHGCTSLAKEISFTTNATLTQHCPDYARSQTNNTQTVKRRKKEVTTNKCLEQVFNLLGWWRRFSRISPKQNKSSLIQ
nr:thymic stromal lymphopoietin [Dasypus novemcinctus]